MTTTRSWLSLNKEWWYDKDVDQLYEEMIHSTLEQAYIKKDKVSIISLKDHNYFSKTQNSRFKNIKKEYKKLSRAGSMPNLNTIVKPHESIKEEIMKEEKQKDSSSKFSRRSTVAQPPIRQIENLKINIESFPEESLNITNKSQIQEETVSNNESSKTKQNTDSDMLTMRYDSLMNKTHKKVGKVQFQSNHVIHSERLILPPVHSVENWTESLKKMPKLVRKLLGKKLKINKIIDQIEQENEKKG